MFMLATLYRSMYRSSAGPLPPSSLASRSRERLKPLPRTSRHRDRCFQAVDSGCLFSRRVHVGSCRVKIRASQKNLETWLPGCFICCYFFRKRTHEACFFFQVSGESREEDSRRFTLIPDYVACTVLISVDAR